jgi:hypothetical protein
MFRQQGRPSILPARSFVMEERFMALLLVAALAGTSSSVATRADVTPPPRTGGIVSDIVGAGHSCKGGVAIEAMSGPEAKAIEARGGRPMIARCDSGETYQIVYGQRPANGSAPAVQSVTPVK